MFSSSYSFYHNQRIETHITFNRSSLPSFFGTQKLQRNEGKRETNVKNKIQPNKFSSPLLPNNHYITFFLPMFYHNKQQKLPNKCSWRASPKV